MMTTDRLFYCRKCHGFKTRECVHHFRPTCLPLPPYRSFGITVDAHKLHSNCLAALEDARCHLSFPSSMARRTAEPNETVVCTVCFTEILQRKHECQACGEFRGTCRPPVNPLASRQDRNDAVAQPARSPLHPLASTQD